MYLVQRRDNIDDFCVNYCCFLWKQTKVNNILYLEKGSPYKRVFPVEIDIVSKIYSCSCSYLVKILLL